ncbi:AAA family ATPase [Alkalicella caledoniensis]|uniref:AAA family ATPase n=1 Tax=Alkalicella caledoniensis TaxID=2731377 RepID=A0A7G9WB59_ALKCA|nr:AAA family ATPase [Alkalicella caledoniensis]QNO15921.1 AAA family ATPase [Alkalicella caledoniensis]
MQIRKIIIRNFQGFGEEDTHIELSDLTTFIGANSSGKTAVLQALSRIFGLYNSQREIKKTDFYTQNNERIEEIDTKELKIEAILDFPELVNNDSSDTVPTFFNQMVIEEQGTVPYCRIRLTAVWKKGVRPEGDIETKLQFIVVPEGEEEDDSNYVNMQNHQRSMIQFIYVPAVRDPLHQLKLASSTILGRILRSIKWSEDLKENLKKQKENISQLIDAQEGMDLVAQCLDRNWKAYHGDDRYSKALLNFGGNDLDDTLRKLEVIFESIDGNNVFSMQDLGDGLRSLFYLSLINMSLEIETKVRKNNDIVNDNPFEFIPSLLTILAVEEPENHISPHLLGRVVKNLREISKQENAQVIVTSHSPSIVKRVDPEDIRHIRICKQNSCTVVRRIYLPAEEVEAYKYVKEAVIAYPELYFAKLVILGEGDSEELILSKLIELKGVEIDSSGISIVPLGGRFVNHFWKLLKQLDIPFITLLDLDLERNTGGWSRLKYIFQQLIENGESIENILGDEIDLDQIHLMNYTENSREELEVLTKVLEEFNVFFSAPLDIDFIMLEKYIDIYKQIVPPNGGPKIPDRVNEYDIYLQRIEKDVKTVLKSEDAEGITYSAEEKELMIWYKYHFLGRGKPSTHLMALSKIGEELAQSYPLVLDKIIESVKFLLSKQSNLSSEEMED